ncbi:MAG: O-methyltransferase [Deltaproteobacteria bacterium]|nr:O-methyltransferase [Deltaproteobacteria bacterium]
MPAPDRWTEVDDYIAGALIPTDPTLDAALEASTAAGLPSIQVSAAQGKLLYLLARMIGARRVLEIGTLGGYSAIWLARALPKDGRLTCLELNPAYADVARANIARAGAADVADVRVGPALETLLKLKEEKAGPFDLAFIDADKANIPAYFNAAIELARPGAVIVVDNVVRDGALADADSDDLSVQGVRCLHEMIAADPRVSATTIQTVGAKGYDGFTLALVND